METIQSANISTQQSSRRDSPARQAGWAALAIFVGWLLAFVIGMMASSVFPGVADQFIPAKIQANVLLASLSWLTQIILGTAFVVLALPLSDYLARPMTLLVRFALIGGLVGGIFLIAAGTGGQENVFVSVFTTAQQSLESAKAIGLPDLTVINVANNLVAGGMRSTAAYGAGWALVLWGIAGLKMKRFPAGLSWVQMITGVLYGLTVWVGPIVGPFLFVGMLIWSLWLGIFLLRVKQNE